MQLSSREPQATGKATDQDRRLCQRPLQGAPTVNLCAPSQKKNIYCCTREDRQMKMPCLAVAFVKKCRPTVALERKIGELSSN